VKNEKRKIVVVGVLSNNQRNPFLPLWINRCALILSPKGGT